MVRELRDSGVTIILTTHYIEEAEEMADRIGIINKGELIAGRRQGRADAQAGQEAAARCICSSRSSRVPAELAAWPLELGDGRPDADIHLRCRSTSAPASPRCCGSRRELGIDFKDLDTSESSLEDIFVSLVRRAP